MNRAPKTKAGRLPRGRRLSIAAILLFFLCQSLLIPVDKSQGDPSVQDNGDGTYTAIWSFDSPSNYTATNVTILSGSASLGKMANWWNQTTQADFDSGTSDNVTTTSTGEVVLSGNQTEMIRNGDLSSDQFWTFVNGSEGIIDSEWSSIQNNIWIHGNGTTTGHGQGVDDFTDVSDWLEESDPSGLSTFTRNNTLSYDGDGNSLQKDLLFNIDGPNDEYLLKKDFGIPQDWSLIESLTFWFYSDTLYDLEIVTKVGWEGADDIMVVSGHTDFAGGWFEVITTKMQYDNRAAAAAKWINWSAITSLSIGVKEYTLGNDGNTISPISVRYLVDDLRMHSVPSVQFDSLDDIAATGWYETYSQNSGDFSQNLAPPIFEGAGNMLVSLTFTNNNNQYGLERNDVGQWNWSGCTEVSVEIYTDDAIGETIHLQLAGEAGKTGTFWITPKQTIAIGWNTYTFNITGFEGSGGNKNSLSAVDTVAMLFKDSAVGVTVPLYFDDIKLLSPGSSQTYYDDGASVRQTFPKLSYTPPTPGQFNLTFDYSVEEIVGASSASLNVFLNTTQVWTRNISSIEPWTPVTVDVSTLISDPDDYDLVFQLRVQVISGTAINVSARLDNISIMGVNEYRLFGVLTSSIHDAGTAVIWKDISWNATADLPTNITFQTRTGASPVIDASWSNWSMDLTNSSGESIPSPAAQYLQYRALLQTGNASLTPILADVIISYEWHYTEGTIDTEDYVAPTAQNWDVFDTNQTEPLNTNVTYFYSTDSGSSWFGVLSGEVLVGVPVPTIRFRARLQTIETSVSPSVLEISLKYRISNPLDHIHMSVGTWSGTSDEWLDIDALGHDLNHNIAPFSEKWETDDPWGYVNSTGFYQPGMVGTWRVFCNNSDNSISNYTLVDVLPGNASRIEVNPWDPGVLTTDDTMMFGATGYDSKGNSRGPVSVNWTTGGGVGTIPGGPSFSALFNATSPGFGTVSADDGFGHTNSTNVFQVVEGSLNRIIVQPDGLSIQTGEQQNFTATGYDSDGNLVPILSPVWDTNAGDIIGSSPSSATLQAYDWEVPSGYIRITAPLQSNVSGVASLQVVTTNTPPTILGIIPDQLKPEDYGGWILNLGSFAGDSQDPPSELTWTITGHNASITSISGDNVKGNHIMTLTTVPNAFGVNDVVFWLRDSGGLVDSQHVTIYITSVNDRPTIQSVTPFTIHFNDPYTFYFYDYVSDIETAKEDLVLTSSDPDHISFNGLWGTFTYPESFSGTTQYPVVTVRDEDGGEMSTVLVVTISDDYVPVLTKELPDITLYEGEEVHSYFNLDDYFTDPDGDSLFYTSGNVHTAIIINQNHSVDFFAPDNWYGVEIVSFRAIDPANARAEDIILVNVLPVNDPPSITGVPDLVVHYEDPSRPFYNYTFDLEPYIHDEDNVTAELILTTSDPAHIFFNDTKGTIMEIHYPESMMGQSVSVKITVSDGLAESSQDINIMVLDDWPPEVVSVLPEFTFFEDTTLPSAFRIEEYFADNDADELTYSAFSSNVTVIIDEGTLQVDLSAAPNWYGCEHVTFRATDPDGGIAEQTTKVNVLPVNDAPEILEIPDITLRVGEIRAIDLSEYIFDIDNDPSDLTIFVSGDNTKTSMTIAGFILVLSYPSGGSDRVHVEVSDGSLETHSYFDVRIVAPTPTIWEQIYWPWSLIVAILASIILVIVGRELFSKIHIDEAFLIYANGGLIQHSVVGVQTDVDEDIFSSMLTAIQEFIKDTFREVGDSRVERIEFGDRKIAIERGEKTYLAVVFTGHENRRNLKPLKDAIEEIEKTYKKELEDWDGFLTGFSGVQNILQKHLGDLRKSGRSTHARD